MSLQIKTILLTLFFLALAAGLIVYGLATWSGIEAAKVDDYQIVIRLTTEPREVGR